MTVGAIFGGIGGALLGAKQAGLRPLYLIEPRSFANPLTIVNNEVSEDFSRFIESFGDQNADIIVGSPSCAQFSKLGMRRKDRGMLNYVAFQEFEVVQFLNQVVDRKPKIFILENVTELLKSFKFQQVWWEGFMPLTRFSMPSTGEGIELFNYEHSILLLDTKEVYGYQRRNRVFIIGWLPDLNLDVQGWKKRVSLLNGKPCSEILSNIPTDIPNQDVPRHTAERIEQFKQLQIGESYYGTQNNRKLVPDKPGFTVTSHCTRHIHFEFPRTLTVRECARLQGFPDDFVFYGTNTSQLDQVGKSISPPVARWIFERIKEDVNGHLEGNP